MKWWAILWTHPNHIWSCHDATFEYNTPKGRIISPQELKMSSKIFEFSETDHGLRTVCWQCTARARKRIKYLSRSVTNDNVSTLKEPHQIETWVLLPSLSPTNKQRHSKARECSKIFVKKDNRLQRAAVLGKDREAKDTVNATKAWVLLDYPCLECQYKILNSRWLAPTDIDF